MKSNRLIEEARSLSPSLLKGQATVIFRGSNPASYIGSSTDLEQRLDEHFAGQACRTTQIDPPAAVLRVEIHPTFTEARRREAQLKRWSRAKKEALICGEYSVLGQLSQSRD